jgi:hypothetical protein
MGGDPIERRIAPSAQWGYQHGGARGGGGFSPRGAAETITATLQDGARGDGRRTRRRACRGPHGRATDVPQWAQRLLDEGAPPGAARRRDPVVAVRNAPRRGRDPRGTRHRGLAPCAVTRAAPPNRRRRPKVPPSPASGRCKRRSRPRRDRDDRGSGQTRSAAGYSPDDGDTSPPIPATSMQEPWPSNARRETTDSLGRAGSYAEPSLCAHDKRWLALVSQAAWAGDQ